MKELKNGIFSNAFNFNVSTHPEILALDAKILLLILLMLNLESGCSRQLTLHNEMDFSVENFSKPYQGIPDTLAKMLLTVRGMKQRHMVRFAFLEQYIHTV